MTPTGSYLIRLKAHLATLAPAERKPFITRQRERWEGLYLQFQRMIGCAGDEWPANSPTAWDYAETMGALDKLEATL